ncbi:TnsA-like heteromeric transposase endonuclease subunit [Cellulomonas sp. PhB150]|uniref:TnsA-like heteromeric transposase endonuclease subunit n=1 Tax=Cellulomonas sp. PhB150 TaxID=2485188 RepID=UPI000F48CD7A|nr:TnsA-like heteromeric transposase endonuclease subunit [Cellulomonas sp. PhB150]ROS23715.1 hypothetical protein EDF34_2775 [Cellulomonas sp. PhB150]
MGSEAPEVLFFTADGGEVQVPLCDADAVALAWSMPKRIPPYYRGQRNYPGLFWSSTNLGHIVYESLLELAWLWLADFDPHVTRIAAQPMLLIGDDNGRARTRYPDFLCLDSAEGVRVVDVKAPALLEKRGAKEALAWTGSVIRDRGWGYEVWVEAPQVTLRNVRLLAAARRPGMVRDVDIEAAVQLCQAPGSTIAEIEQRLARQSVQGARLVILAALWIGLLKCNMAEPIDAATVVAAS